MKKRIDLVNERVVNVRDAAKHFGISPSTAWRLVLTGRVPSVMIQGSRRVTIESFARAFEPAQSADDVESACAAEGL